MSGLEEMVAAEREHPRTFTPQGSDDVGDPAISTAELRRRLADTDLTIVDVRALPAYNGWRLNGEARGGHIPRAVAFPSAWLSSVDDAEVGRLLRSKAIVASQEVVLYGDGSDDVS